MVIVWQEGGLVAALRNHPQTHVVSGIITCCTLHHHFTLLCIVITVPRAHCGRPHHQAGAPVADES